MNTEIAAMVRGWSIQRRRSGRYQVSNDVINRGGWWWKVSPKINDIMAGKKVRLRIIAAIKAKPMVNAIGLKMIPSTPPIRNSGEYATIMMQTE